MGTSSSMSLHDQLRTATMPVIERTAQHGDSEEKALDLGAQDYLAKPVPPRSLTRGCAPCSTEQHVSAQLLVR